jgi:ribosomal protein S18 acetylase RimI-like enzyme
LTPEDIKRLPRYPVVPAVRIGRLAVDQRFQKRGLGKGLLIDITLRVIGTEIGVALLVVHAKDERAPDFYARYQFRTVKSSGRTMFLPMATAVNLFASRDLH